MKTPLYNALLRHRDMHRVSMHTPGHKNTLPWGNELFSIDYTELPDTDSLFEADGAILRAEKVASEVFGVKGTFFSAGGCTLCIQSMLRLIAPHSNKVIFGRTIHKSAINTVALLGIDPVFVPMKNDAGPDLPGRVSGESIEKALLDNPDATGVYITSPDYFGVISDVRAIAEKCAQYKVPLVVDNAHGTHLKFLRHNMHPIKQGAAMSADSAHKTLPVLTGGAFLHVDDDQYISNAKQAMSLFASTSPSYPIMASLDCCCDWLINEGKGEFARLEECVTSIVNASRECGILTPEGCCDPTRISLNVRSIGVSGMEAALYFRENGFEPEYFNESYIILIPTPFNKKNDLDRLRDVIVKMPKASVSVEYDKDEHTQLPYKAMLPREAMLSCTEVVDLSNAIGRVCAETICPCPPGVPVVMPGEVVDLCTIKKLKKYRFFKLKVVK